jgi:hypothetical protein
MRMSHVMTLFALIGLVLGGCGGGSAVPVPGDGQVVDVSTPDGPPLPDLPPKPDGKPTANIHDPNNPTKDTDCDGLSDAEEFSRVYADGKSTDPDNPDTDGDGIPDGVELGRTTSVDANCGFKGDADPATTTLPTVPDSDLDGRDDGVEDANKDGKHDASETDATNPDTDGDGLSDGTEGAVVNGTVQPGETDPRKKDTDGDGINDGVETTTTKTNPVQADTDNDGCKDGAEDLNQNGVVDPGETDPKDGKDCGATNLTDTDNDGIPDKIEDKNGNGVYDASAGETNWQNPDTDADGLPDGVEDANKDGQVSIGETDPRLKDSDCDGLIDGPTAGATLGEDLNGNGVVDAGETDPTNSDSDADGLVDGLELGVKVNPDPTNCKNFVADGDTNTTDPNKKDSDGDGISDGSEDANQNGKVDPGELDPKNPGDGTGPAGKVCTAQNLVPIIFKEESQPDIKIALPTSFKEIVNISVGGKTKGVMGYDATNKVAFLVYRQAAPGSAKNPTADESALRSTIQGVGGLTNPTTQTFSTWDGYPALSAFYDQTGNVDLKARANALANALAGAGAGALVGNAGVAGPFKLQAEYVHRSDKSVVVLVALTPLANYKEPAIFTVGDLAGGSALAQFGDGSAVQCEVFNAGSGVVDFIFSVDNSGSMGSSQQALANTAAAMIAELSNSALDWRIGLVTNSYHEASSYNGSGVFRGFTRNADEFKGWLTQNNTCSAGFCNKSGGLVACTNNNDCWIGINGYYYEDCLQAAAKAVHDVTPGTVTEQKKKARAGAAIVIIILGDADDQSPYSAAQYSTFFNTPNGTVGSYTNKSGKKITVHGIICPAGQNCNSETQQSPQRNAAVITATGGIRGAINQTNSIAATMGQIVKNSIAAAGYQLLKPPIGASIKVALQSVQDGVKCTKDNIPRSRVDGFDFDGVNQTISFFGACRPGGTTATPGAVSYKYWIDKTPNADSNKLPCENDVDFDPNEIDWCKGKLACNLISDVCECPANCGGPAPKPGMVCNTNRLVCDWVCTPDCGGACTGYQTCNTQTCDCECKQSASCPAGYFFSNAECKCKCSVPALNCNAMQDADEASCSCVCKPDCGGCPTGKKCNVSSCKCEGIG